MLTPEELESKRAELEERRRLKREQRRRRLLFYAICIGLGVILLVGTALWSYFSGLPGPIASLFRMGKSQDIVNVLVLGTDSGINEAHRTDTMLLFSIDQRDGSVGVLSIPRDTRVQIPGRRGFDRVNAAHAHGGPKLAVRTVEQLLAVPIDYYVRIDFQGFEAIIDTLGGVVIDVERPMYYVDRAQGLEINLKAGVQLLNGKDALNYVRYRGDSLGDVALIDPVQGVVGGRVERQLKFVRALLAQALNAKNLLQAPALIAQLRGSVDANIPTDEAMRLLNRMKDLKTGQLVTAVLPGEPQTVGGASYWVPDEPKLREIVNKLVIRRHDMVRVEVLNGNGMSGAAAEAADLLRRKGFEVVAVGNADRFDYAETAVIPRRGDMTTASQVAEALGGRVVGTGGSGSQPPVYSNDADVTVIIGRDYQI